MNCSLSGKGWKIEASSSELASIVADLSQMQMLHPNDTRAEIIKTLLESK
jgi:hypothetical protein